jgi:hypothetical protein
MEETIGGSSVYEKRTPEIVTDFMMKFLGVVLCGLLIVLLVVCLILLFLFPAWLGVLASKLNDGTATFLILCGLASISGLLVCVEKIDDTAARGACAILAVLFSAFTATAAIYTLQASSRYSAWIHEAVSWFVR